MESTQPKKQIHHPKGPQIHVRITAQSIVDGKPRDSRHCMIADAIKRDYPQYRAVAVDLQTIRVTDPLRHLRFTFMTPRVAQVHLVRFDQGKPLEPLDFKLRGAQVTKAGGRMPGAKNLTPKQAAARKAAGHRLNETLRKTRLAARGHGSHVVPDRIGGKTPPVQVTNDGVPFSRRRAFGLRALEY